LVALVLATGVGVRYYARSSGDGGRAVASLVLTGMFLAAAMSYIAMLYVVAQHGDI